MQVLGLYALHTGFGITNSLEAAKLAYAVWQLFVFPTLSVHFLFDQRPKNLMFIYLGYHFTTLMVESQIFTYFK